ncbi:MAG: glycosyltransferase family 2 protein [Bacteriovoracaceae bacterium]|nr:glycosyltransferase family 2 protein [Bacteroidota bacterium]
MKLSIIITSWNTRRLLHACLQSIRIYPPRCTWEIIVVDNASIDGSAEMVSTDFPEIQLIKNSVNTGYAGGNNIGFANSSGEYVLLLGSDTEVFPGTIQRMADFLDEKKTAGIVSCRLQLPDGSLQHSCKRFPSIGNAVAMYCSLHFLNRRYLMSSFDHTVEKEIDQPDATCIMIRRSALDGYIFDERFSILYNDVDLCQRIKEKGLKIIFTPTAKIIHHGSQSTKQASPELRLVMYRNILMYYQLYFGFSSRIMLTPILMFRYFVTTRSTAALKLLSLP